MFARGNAVYSLVPRGVCVLTGAFLGGGGGQSGGVRPQQLGGTRKAGALMYVWAW